MFPYGAGLIPAVKFSWSMGVQLRELLLYRSPSDYERNRLLRNNASCPGCSVKPLLSPLTPNPFSLLSGWCWACQRLRSSQWLLRTMLMMFHMSNIQSSRLPHPPENFLQPGSWFLNEESWDKPMDECISQASLDRACNLCSWFPDRITCLCPKRKDFFVPEAISPTHLLWIFCY